MPEENDKQVDEKYCSSCGKIIKKEAEICPHCGVRQIIINNPSINRMTAVLLALLLGSIGAHKFYLNNSGLGVLYLCFCWTFIPACLGLIEGLVYLGMTDESFIAKYGRR